MPRPVKGVAYNVSVSLYKTDGTLIANPGTVTAKISKDFGDYADVGTVSEEDSTYSQVKLALTATEMNADYVDLYVVDNTSGCIPVTVHIATEAATPDVNVTQLGGVAQSLTDLKDFADTGYDPSTHKVGGVVTTDTATALGAAYDAAKTAAAPGAKMDLVDAPNATALTAIKTKLEEAGSTLATLLSRIVGTLLAGNHSPQSGDGYAVVSNATHGNAALKTLVDAVGVNAASAAGADFGDDTCTLTIRTTTGGAVIPDAQVYIGDDATPTNRTRTKTTDSLGQVQFDLTDGTTYYIWISSDAFDGTNPTAFVAAKDV